MKRSEMIDAIKGDLARMDLDFMHGRNLDKIPYHIRVEVITTYVLSFAERYGMLPPPDNTDVIHGSLVYCYYIDKTYRDRERLIEIENSYGKLDYSRSRLWEPEDE